MPRCDGRPREALRFEFVPTVSGLVVRIDNEDDPPFWCEITLSLVELLRTCSQIKTLQVTERDQVVTSCPAATRATPADNGG